MPKKRSNGEGNVRKTKNGSWRGEIMDGCTSDGKKNIVRFTAETRAEVLDKIRAYRTNMDSGVRIDRKMHFASWADAWYEDYKSEVQPSTYSGYQYTLNVLKKEFGEQALADILPIHINRFLDKLTVGGYSLSMIRKCRAMLIQIFDAAVANDFISKNPGRLAKATRYSFSQEDSRKDAFTDKEFSLLMKHLPDSVMGNSLRAMLGTGIRVQELLALRPCDITADGSVIRGSAAVKMVNGRPLLGPPKSKRSKRNIPVPEDFRIYVRSLRENGGQAFIWTSTRDNLLYSVGTFRNCFYKEIEKIPGVRKLSPHCCRHTYVTRLQARGVSMETIAALTGHSDIKTTEGCLHQSVETLAKAVEALNGKAAS